MQRPIDRERLISLADAGRCIERRTGKRPYLETLRRWASRGVGGRILESVRVGRERFTSEEAIQRFMHELPAVADEVQAARSRSPKSASIRRSRKGVGR